MSPCIAAWAALSAVLAGCETAPPTAPATDAETAGEAAQAVATVCDDYNAYGNLYWGELHLHTSYSLDAYSFGTRADPAQAFAFAKGQSSIVIAEGSDAGPGATITQERPLDFSAITDHSEWLSVTETCVLDEQPGDPDYDSTYCQMVRSSNPTLEGLTFASLLNHGLWPCDPTDPTCAPQVSAYERMIDAANTANDECSFSALIGYEWTDIESTNDGSATNHRNVVFASETVPPQPYDAVRYETPPDLWAALAAGCDPSEGCDAITIPHNTNQSAGVSLQVWDPSPTGVDLQSRYQVAAEIFQHKGNSECYYDPDDPAASNDDLCEMEHTDDAPIVRANFVREALADGIQYAADHPLQGNPLKLGIVGATDTHNASPGYVDEASFKGHTGRLEVSADERLSSPGGDFNPGGITGVWAPQNTRADIFAAIKGRESFATSGPRIRVRVFQTKSITACLDPQFPQQIVDNGQGVPMGGTIRASDLTAGNAMKLAIWAFPDAYPQSLPNGSSGTANFDRVQVIKSYIDASGNAVTDAPYDVTSFPAAGGCKLWTDPSFDPSHRAVYYVRVVQVPTWRWSHHDCLDSPLSAPVKCLPGGEYNRTVQERAWTSPLWYVPGN